MKFIEVKKYRTDSAIDITMKRLSDPEWKLKAKFRTRFAAVPFPSGKGPCGNVQVAFSPKGKAKLCNSASDLKGHIYSFQQISSALALYRAVSIFQTGVNVERSDFYKTNWEICLLHEDTGQHLMLGEWKGGFQIFTEASNVKQLPKEFVKDAEAFLTWFVSNKVPIGYDGVVAGSVA